VLPHLGSFGIHFRVNLEFAKKIKIISIRVLAPVNSPICIFSIQKIELLSEIFTYAIHALLRLLFSDNIAMVVNNFPPFYVENKHAY
jgi:hypothetical protein